MLVESGGPDVESRVSFKQNLTFHEAAAFFAEKGIFFDLPQMKALKVINSDGGTENDKVYFCGEVYHFAADHETLVKGEPEPIPAPDKLPAEVDKSRRIDMAGKTDRVQTQRGWYTRTYDEDGYSYSGSLNLYYVDDLDNLPDYDVVTLSTDSGKTRFSSRTSDDGLRTVQLVATAENDLDYFTYSITSGEGIATVDSETGIVTFTDYAFGNVEITASPRYASGKSRSITLDVYRATVTSAVQLVDAVNKVWRDEFVWADGEFEGDWFKTSAQTKSRNGFSFTCNSDLDDDPFCVSINATSNLDQIGESKIRSNGNIDLEWYNIESGWAGSLGKDGIDTVSTNNQSIVIDLPYNQGQATIIYKSIVVNGRGGSYSVDFASDVLGPKGTNLDNSNILDGEGITKLLY